MGVKEVTGYFPTTSLISNEPRRHYRTRINPIHWQLRSLIGVSSANTVYYPTGLGNLHIQEFNTVTRKSETIAFLSFSPRCLVAKHGWICCGGEVGEFVAIRPSEQTRSSSGSGRSSGSNNNNHGSGGDGDGANTIFGGGPSEAHPTMDDEEYDDFDLRMDESVPALVTVPSRLVAKSQKFGSERVNCITIWAPPELMAADVGAYKSAMAVLANNDKHVTVVDLDKVEAIDELTYPDCVNRAVLSPDGRLLAAVSDDPFLYIHERVPRSDASGHPLRLSRSEQLATRRQYEWRLLVRHQLRGQDKHDRSVRRGSFAACFSNTGQFLAVGTQYGVISVFDTRLLTEPGERSLVACFTSSNPMTDAGAVREMSFCPGPYDLLAWSEDHGAVGMADMRNNYVSRQTLKLCDEDGYEHVAINQIIHINDEFVEERRRRRRSQQGGEEGGGGGGTRNILAGTRLSSGEYDVTSGEQAPLIRYGLEPHSVVRIGDELSSALDESPSTLEEPSYLEAIQESQGQLQHDLLMEAMGSLTREQREQRERERERDVQARRSLGFSRQGSSTSANASANANGNTNGGSSSSSRPRERGENMAVAVNDILGSLRSARDSGELERRRLSGTQGLLQAARQPSRGGGPATALAAAAAAAASAGAANEESASDDELLSVTALPVTTRRQQRQTRWGSIEMPSFNFTEAASSYYGLDTRTMEYLHAYTLGESGPEENGASGSRRDRTGLLGSMLLSQTGTPSWERTGMRRTGLQGASAAPNTTTTATADLGPLDYSDGHTAGLAWSDDGGVLFIGTEGGIFEFRVNTLARRFHPSVTAR